MSEYTELQNDLLTVMDSVNGYGAAVNRYADVVNEQVAKLWQDNAELRDEINAVANRVESLTRAVYG
jgi:cell division septum initiation protein DivIVA